SDLLDPKALGELRPLVHVDLADPEAVALLACDVREQTLHPPGGSGAAGGEEHEERTVVRRHLAHNARATPAVTVPVWVPGTGSAWPWASGRPSGSLSQVQSGPSGPSCSWRPSPLRSPARLSASGSTSGRPEAGPTSSPLRRGPCS